MSGILPIRFNSTTRWKDVGHSRMNAWLNETRRQGGQLSLLFDMLNKLRLRRTEVAAAGATGSVEIAWAVVEPLATWVASGGGDTFKVRLGEESGIEVAKPVEVRRSYTEVQVEYETDGGLVLTRIIINGFKYTAYGADSMSRTSLEFDLADPVGNSLSSEFQRVRPEYYDGQPVLIARGLTGGTKLLHRDPELPPVVWQEMGFRVFAQALPPEDVS